MVWQSDRPRKRDRHRVAQLIVLGDRSQQFRAAPQGQRRATHDLVRRDRIAERLLHRGVHLGRHLGVGERLDDLLIVAVAAQLGMSRRGPPGDDRPRRRLRGRDRLLELHLHHPVGESLVEPQGVGIVQHRLVVDAHLVITLAAHRLVADRVDPERLRRLDRASQLGLKRLQRGAIVAVVERYEGFVVGEAGRHPRQPPDRRPVCRTLDDRRRRRRSAERRGDKNRGNKNRGDKKCRQQSSDHGLAPSFPETAPPPSPFDLTSPPPSLPAKGGHNRKVAHRPFVVPPSAKSSVGNTLCGVRRHGTGRSPFPTHSSPECHPGLNQVQKIG